MSRISLRKLLPISRLRRAAVALAAFGLVAVQTVAVAHDIRHAHHGSTDCATCLVHFTKAPTAGSLAIHGEAPRMLEQRIAALPNPHAISRETLTARTRGPPSLLTA